MSVNLVGYQLVDSSNTVIQAWGGVWGQCPGVPNMITLPNDDQVHCPELNVAYAGYTLIPWELEPIAITGDQVDAERERRIALPLTVTLSVGPILIDTDPLSIRNLSGLATVGQYLIMTSSTQTTTFRDANNTSYTLTPTDLISMGLQVAQRLQFVYTKSWALKATTPIPQNYTDDSFWV